MTHREGVIGSFNKVDAALNLIKLADVMPEPGHRYALLYGLADPTFDKSVAEFSRFSDAAKLMALASFSKRSKPSDEEEKIIAFLMRDCLHLNPKGSVKDLAHFHLLAGSWPSASRQIVSALLGQVNRLKMLHIQV